jgi:hypothetical protein
VIHPSQPDARCQPERRRVNARDNADADRFRDFERCDRDDVRPEPDGEPVASRAKNPDAADES